MSSNFDHTALCRTRVSIEKILLTGREKSGIGSSDARFSIKISGKKNAKKF